MRFLGSIGRRLRRRGARLLAAGASVSVRTQIAGTFAALLAVSIASLGAATLSGQRETLEEHLRRRAELMARRMAGAGEAALLTRREPAALAAIRELQDSPGVAYGLVVDGDGRVFADTVISDQGKVLSGQEDLRARRSGALLFQTFIRDGEPVLEAAMPIFHKGGGLRLGTARVGVSQREMLQALRRQKVLFISLSLLFLAAGVLAAFALADALTLPLVRLTHAMQAAARGDLGRTVETRHRDEVGVLAEAFNRMILGLREKLHMEKYLSDSALISIRRNRDMRLRLGGEQKHVTALFSDVRGFTAMAEKMKPEEVVGLLNIYLNLQGKVIRHWSGMVDKYVGDAVMAIFEGEEQELNAVRAAVEIQRYCEALNGARAAAGERGMSVGIGIHSGAAVMGNMGSEEQMNYTVIGDAINLAARLCATARPGQVVITKAAAESARGRGGLRLKRLDPLTVKGKEKPVDIYEVLDADGAARRHMRRPLELAAVYRLPGLAEDASPAVIKNLGPGGGLMETLAPLGVGSRLDLDLRLPDGMQQVAGVVCHVSKQSPYYRVGVRFEGVDEDVRRSIIRRIHQIEREAVEDDPGDAPFPGPDLRFS